MLPRCCAAVLASDVSLAALEKHFSALSLGCHLPREADECVHSSSLPDCLGKNCSSVLGFQVLDVDPIGINGSVCLSSSGSVYVGLARFCWLQVVFDCQTGMVASGLAGATPLRRLL